MDEAFVTAPLALILWPFVTIALFAWTRPQVALVVSVIGGFLLLPTGTNFDLPVLPTLDKQSIPAFASLLCMIALFAGGRRQGSLADGEILRGWIPRNPVVLFCLALLVLGPFMTVYLNPDPQVYGPRVLPALRPYDALGTILDVLTLLLPFLLARKLLSSSEGHRILLVAIVLSAVGYSFLALYEVRMSPQLSNMVYGFFPHSWAQHIRAGGFRPIVFLLHGLILGIFLSVAFISAVGLAKITEGKMRQVWLLIAVWLFGTLVLSKSVGALLIAVAIAGIMLFLPRWLQKAAVIAIALCVLVYPVLRANDLVPVESVLSIAEKYSAERAESFAFRLKNEQDLLNKANERPFFGWGGWGRSMIFDEETGRELSTPDGIWIIVFGVGGWVRYFGLFGLLTWGLVAMLRQKQSKPEPATLIVALALAGNLVDLLPNSGATPITWMLAGALCGRLERGAKVASSATPVVEAPVRAPTYARQLPEAAARNAASPLQKRTPERETVRYRREF